MKSLSPARALTVALLVSVPGGHGIANGLPASTATGICPAYAFGRELPNAFVGTPRGNLQLFARTAAASTQSVDQPAAPQWKRLQLQVDPLDAEGLLVRDPEAKPGLAARSLPELTADDRLVFETTDFGARLASPAETKKFSCQSGRPHLMHELSAPDGTTGNRVYAYLVSCPAEGRTTDTLGEAAVVHDQKARTITSGTFSYKYLPTNQLLFEEIRVRRALTGGQEESTLAASAASLLLRLDVRNFLTLEFDNSDVESYVEATRHGDLGIVGQINFYMRLLVFKVNLKMATVASFYRSSANIPAIIDVPVNAPRRLRPGSGMIYSYNLDSTRLDATGETHPVHVYDAARIRKGWQATAELGLRTCNRTQTCVYRLGGDVAGERFGLEMGIDRSLVERGFFPMLVHDSEQFAIDVGWEKERKTNGPPRTAMYFETSGLPKGKHRMDYWIRVGGTGAGKCPAEFRHEGLVTAVGTAH